MKRTTKRQKHVNEYLYLQGHHECGITKYIKKSRHNNPHRFSSKLAATKLLSLITFLFTGFYFITESNIDLTSPGSITIDNLFIMTLGILMILVVPVVLIYEKRMKTNGRIYGLE